MLIFKFISAASVCCSAHVLNNEFNRKDEKYFGLWIAKIGYHLD